MTASCFYYCFIRGRCDHPLKRFPLLLCDFPVCSFLQSIQSQIHDPYSFQCEHTISEIFTHSADLAVQSLGEDDTEAVLSRALCKTGSCDRIQNGNSPLHALEELFADRLIYCYQILFLMAVSRAHDTVYQVSLIGEKEKPLGILVKASHRIHPQRIVQIFRYCHLLSLLLCAADDPPGLVEEKKNLFFIFLYRNAVYTDTVCTGNLFPALGSASVYCDPFFQDQAVCLSSGADACIA